MAWKAAIPEAVSALTMKKRANQAAFLAAYRECGIIGQAAAAAGLSYTAHSRWMHSDAAYGEEFRDAQEQAADRLEEEARRRAVEGTEEPVFYKGEACGKVRKYSDTLLQTLLEATRPAKFSKRQRIVIEETNISDAELERIAASGASGGGAAEVDGGASGAGTAQPAQIPE